MHDRQFGVPASCSNLSSGRFRSTAPVVRFLAGRQYHGLLATSNPNGEFLMHALFRSALFASIACGAIASGHPVSRTVAADEPAREPEPGLADLLAVNRRSVAEQLKLSDAQAAEVSRIVKDFQSQLERIQRAYPAGAQDQEGLTRRRELLAKLGALRVAAAARLGQLLTPDQTARLVTLNPSGPPSVAKEAGITFAQRRFARANPETGSLDNRVLQLKRQGSQAQVIDAANHTVIGMPMMHDEERLIVCHAFSADGRYVATGTGKIPSIWTRGTERGDEGEVRVWEVQSGKLLAAYRTDSYVTGVRFGEQDGTVEVMSDPINGR